MKYALKSVLGLADVGVGVLHGTGMGMAPGPHPDVLKGQTKVSND